MEISNKKKCFVAAIVILVLLSSGFPLHTHSHLTLRSWRSLVKFLLYLLLVIFGTWYVWRRLVKDIERDIISNPVQVELPSASGKKTNSTGKKTNSNEADKKVTNHLYLFAIWKLSVQLILVFIVCGFIMMRSKSSNRKITYPEIASYVAVGWGAFLVSCLVMCDLCILLYLISSKFIFMSIRLIKSTYNSTEYDNEISALLPSQLFCFTLNDLKLNWRTFCVSWKKAAFCVGVTFFVTFYSLIVAHRGPSIHSFNVPVQKLPASLHGFKIAMVSDIHIGPWLSKGNLETVIDPIKNLHAEYGVYFVTGNHDYFNGDVDHWFPYLEERGIQTLNNRYKKICHRRADVVSDDCFNLAGTEDFSAGNYKDHSFNVRAAIAGIDAESATVLLTHQPLGAKEALQLDFNFDLILSGHTHGGQFFPASLAIYFTNPFYYGLYHPKPNTYLYVSSGAWYWGMPMRFPANPEIALITLDSGNVEQPSS